MTSLASTSSSPPRWTEAQLSAARQDGDPEADALAKLIFASPQGQAGPESRLGYNHLVDLADVLDSSPELLLVEGSNFNKDMSRFPEELRHYYNPMPAPAWVDSEKLRIASDLWKENSLAMLGILYAASLPACYLMKNGVSALYKTEKLRDHKYIFQRIYETGLMLEAVMNEGGLMVVHDVLPDPGEMVARSLNAVDSGGEWKKVGQQIVRAGRGSPVPVDPKQAQSLFTKVKADAGVASFLWGRGYISAKKVRLLHASMRFLLTNPGAMAPRPDTGAPPTTLAERLGRESQSRQWPSAELGVPVNQEDLAYTLLTFSYLLPKGMESWGDDVTLEQKEAFLHLWRVVGHIMGLRDDLMTDNWEEAESLYQAIHKRQAGKSESGMALTDAVMWFLRTYLPTTFGLRDLLPVILIADQLGDDVKDLVSDDEMKKLGSLQARCLHGLMRASVVFYYRYYQRVLAAFPISRRVFGDLFLRASDELVNSWRDEYNRQPFYVPKDASTWELRRGVDDQFSAQLSEWRGKLFFGVLYPMVLMGISAFALCLAIVLLPVQVWPAFWTVLAINVVTFVAGVWRIDMTLPKIFSQRPQLQGINVRGPQPHR